MDIRKVIVLKHPNGNSPNYYVRYWVPKPDGQGWQEKWKSTRTTVKKDAEAFRRKIELELSGGKTAGEDMPWKLFVDTFLESHLVRKPASTLSAYETCLGAFTKVAKPRSLGTIDRAALEDFASTRLKRGIAPATVNKDLRHVRAALRWAELREYLSKAPSFRGVFVRDVRKVPVTIPTEDFQAIILALRSPELQLTRRPAEWWRVFLYVSYYLGLRRGEALTLAWSQVNLATGEVHVAAQTSKGRKERLIPLAEDITALLAEWHRQQGKVTAASPVLPWPHDTYRLLYDDWHAIQNAAGIAPANHYMMKNCRSSCASELIAKDVPTAVVKEWLGHASMATTEGYYINAKPALRAAANKQVIWREK